MLTDQKKNEKLKVLLAAPLPPPDYGGIANWTRIVRGVLGDQPDIDLRIYDTTARYRAVTNRSLTVRWVGGSVQALRDSWLIYREMKNNRPDLLHLCTSGGPATLKDAIILRICKWLRVPSIIHYRMGRLPAIITARGVEWIVTRYAMCLADVVIPLDKTSESKISTALPHINILKLPNMVEIEDIDRICRERPASPPCPEGSIRLVFAGHIIPTKGIRELVLACMQVEDNRLRLDLLGPYDPGFLAEIQQIASTAQNEDWLRYLGSVDHDEAIRNIANADIFVLPSYTEGMPNVVLEAMACSRAIIGTTVGAVPEMLDIGGPQECGICVPPRDVSALAEALRRLLGNPQLRRQFGLKARQRAEELYSVPVACAQLVRLWQSLRRRN